MTIVAAIASAVIVVAGLGVAVWLIVRGRSRGVKLLAIPLVLALVQWIVVPVIGAALATVPVRHPVPAAAGIGVAGARDVVFRASDGTRLAALWVPGRTGAAVIVAHGSHGDRGDTLPYLRMLHDAGYGVLAYDARGHGRSDGTTNALGWDGAADVAGAVAYLRGDPGVDEGGIAMLGLSMGAEAALRAAADGVPLRAVVADGAGASTSGDRALVRTGALAPIEIGRAHV